MQCSNFEGGVCSVSSPSDRNALLRSCIDINRPVPHGRYKAHCFRVRLLMQIQRWRSCGDQVPIMKMRFMHAYMEAVSRLLVEKRRSDTGTHNCI
jgi:hypothetical protein